MMLKPNRHWLWLLLLLPLGWLIHNTAQNHFARFVSNRIEVLSEGRYTLSYDALRFNPLNGRLTLLRSTLTPNSDLADTLGVKGYFPRITVQVERWYAIYFTRELVLGDVFIDQPKIAVYRKFERDNRATFSLEAGDLYLAISDYIRVLNIRRLEINHAQIDYQRNTALKRTRLNLPSVQVVIENILVDSLLQAENQLPFAQHVSLQLDKLKYQLPDSVHQLDIGSVALSTREESLVFTNTQLNAIHPHPAKPHYTISVPTLAIRGINFAEAYRNNQLQIDSVQMQEPNYRARHIARSTEIATSEGTQANVLDFLSEFFNGIHLGHVVAGNGRLMAETAGGDTLRAQSLNLSCDTFAINFANWPEPAVYSGPKHYRANLNQVSVRGADYALTSDALEVTPVLLALSRSSFMQSSANGLSLETDSLTATGAKAWDFFSDEPFLFKTVSVNQAFVQGTLRRGQKKTTTDGTPSLPFTIEKFQTGSLGFDITLLLSNGPLRLSASQFIGELPNPLKTNWVLPEGEYTDLICDFPAENVYLKTGVAHLDRTEAGYNVRCRQTNAQWADGGINASLNDVALQTELNIEGSTVHPQKLKISGGTLKLTLDSVNSYSGTTNSSQKNIIFELNKTGIEADWQELAIKTVANRMLMETVSEKYGGWRVADMDLSDLSVNRYRDSLLVTSTQCILEERGTAGVLTLREITGSNSSVELRSNAVMLTFDSVINANTRIERISEISADSLSFATILNAEGQTAPFTPFNFDLKINVFNSEVISKSNRKLIGLARGRNLNVTISDSLLKSPLTLLNDSVQAQIDTLASVQDNLVFAASDLTFKDKSVKVKNFHIVDEDVRIELQNFEVNNFDSDGSTDGIHADQLLCEGMVVTGLMKWSATSDNKKTRWPFHINDLQIKDVEIPALEENLAMERGTIRATHLQRNAQGRISATDILFTGDKLAIPLRGGMHLTIDEAKISPKSQRITLDGICFAPEKGVEAYRDSLAYQADVVDVTMDQLILHQPNLDLLLNNEGIDCESIKGFGGITHIYRDKRKPLPDSVYKPLPTEWLSNLKFILAIDTVNLKDQEIIYHEIHDYSSFEGSISLTRANLEIVNIFSQKNEQAGHDNMRASFNARVYGDALLTANLSFNRYSELGAFDFILQCGGMSMLPFNAILEPGASLRIKRGNLYGIQFRASGNDDFLTGTMGMFYNDLQVQLLSKRAVEERTVTTSLGSFLANTVVRQKRENFAIRKYRDVYYERDTSRSMINYLIKSTLAGIRANVGLARYSRKVKRALKDSTDR